MVHTRFKKSSFSKYNHRYVLKFNNTEGKQVEMESISLDKLEKEKQELRKLNVYSQIFKREGTKRYYEDIPQVM